MTSTTAAVTTSVAPLDAIRTQLGAAAALCAESSNRGRRSCGADRDRKDTEMDASQRDEFLNAYYKLLIRVWNDPAEMQRLIADPTAVATAAGLPVAAGARVEVDQSENPSGESDIEDQIRDYFAGEQTGVHVLYVSPEPQIDLQQLSDDDLSGVAGGNIYCCCPCCCCG